MLFVREPLKTAATLLILVLAVASAMVIWDSMSRALTQTAAFA